MTRRTCGKCGTYAPLTADIHWMCPSCNGCDRVIVTGGRDYKNFANVYGILDQIDPAIVAHGACRTGADHFASLWATRNNKEQIPFPADWSWGRRAGPMRNREMVKAGADLVLVFPGGEGTRDCMSKAFEAGLSVRIVKDLHNNPYMDPEKP